MREIRERIWELSGDDGSETQPSDNVHGQQGNENGQGQQNRFQIGMQATGLFCRISVTISSDFVYS